MIYLLIIDSYTFVIFIFLTPLTFSNCKKGNRQTDILIERKSYVDYLQTLSQ